MWGLYWPLQQCISLLSELNLYLGIVILWFVISPRRSLCYHFTQSQVTQQNMQRVATCLSCLSGLFHCIFFCSISSITLVLYEMAGCQPGVACNSSIPRQAPSFGELGSSNATGLKAWLPISIMQTIGQARIHHGYWFPFSPSASSNSARLGSGSLAKKYHESYGDKLAGRAGVG